MKYITIEEVKKHFSKGIKKVVGLTPETEEVYFYCKDGTVILMYHSQDCCEYVRLYEDDCLINHTDIFTDCDWCQIEETIREDENAVESATWTYYNFKTNKGYDNMRWLGESNGYYSESVDFAIVKEQEI